MRASRITAAFVVFVALWAIGAHAAIIERIEASVNTSLILLSDVVRFRQSIGLRAQLDPLFSGTRIAADGAKATDRDIVQFLVDEKVIALQFPATDQETEQEINSIVNNNHITRDQLKGTLQSQGFSYDDYFEMIRASLSKRSLIDRDIRTKVIVSDDDVKNYFISHYTQNSSAPKAYHVRLIVVSPSNYRSALLAKETAEHALQSLHAGEPFDDVAKRVSDDPSAPTGGDLGVLSEDQFSALIRTEIKKLKVGEVSPVFGSAATAFLIIKLVDVTSGEDSRYDKLKDEIRGQLASSEYQHQVQLWLERQHQQVFIHFAGQPTILGTPGVQQ